MKDKFMNSDDFKYLPRGVADFPQLRNSKKIYVDKTALIYELANITNGYFFLSRPRRFGKTLLISTFESLFKNGLQDFKGLAIEKLWVDKTYPVVHLDFSGCKASDIDEFKRIYTEMVENAFTRAGLPLEVVDERCQTISSRVENLVLGLGNLQIVLLIDEYDAPLNYCLHDPELFNKVRHELSFFYSMLKRISGKLRFFFFTGICKYKNLSIFSDTNYVTDISLDTKYGTLLGYTDDEVREYFTPFVENAARVLGITVEECFAKLKRHYDGFCFDEEASTHVHTPWSVLSFLNSPEKGFRNYWYSSGGSASVLLNYIADHALQDPVHYDQDIKISMSDLDSSRELNSLSDYVLLNQTGYLSIKRVSPLGTTAVLNYPNEEVAESMAQLYKDRIFSIKSTVADSNMAADELFYDHVPEEIPSLLNSVLTSIDYKNFPIRDESSLRANIFFFIKGAGIKVFSELHNAYGRSDLEFKIGNKAYVLELKYDRDGNEQKLLEEAKKQIIERHYGEHFKTDKIKPELIRMALVYSQTGSRFVAHAVL